MTIPYKDIEGVALAIGDIVYYSRKSPYAARGQLIRGEITKITSNYISIKGLSKSGMFRASRPHDQLVKIVDSINNINLED